MRTGRRVTAPGASALDRRAAIIDATLALIARNGVAAVTHRAVAREAGVSLAATTYYFTSKEEIIEEALAHAAGTEMERFEAAGRELGERIASPEDWSAVLADWLVEQLSPAGRSALIAQYQLQLQAAWSPRLRELSAAWTARDREFARGLLERAGSPSPEPDAALIVGAIEGMRLQALAGSEAPPDREQMRERLLRLFHALTA